MKRDPHGLYDVARQVTDEVLGPGSYAQINAGNPDPGVQQAIRRSSRPRKIEDMAYTPAEELMISLENYLDDTEECGISCGRCAHCLATSLVHALITPGRPTPIQDFVIEPTPEDLWPRDAGDG